MASRHRKRKDMSPAEVERFLTAATALHHAIVDPRISVLGEHYRAKSDLHEALKKAIVEITGKQAPWIRMP